MSNIPPKYQNATTDNTTPQEVRDYIVNLDEHVGGDGVGLLLQGKPGVGKTHAACAVLTAAAKMKYSVRFITLAGYVQMLLDLQRYEKAWSVMKDEEAYENWADLLRMKRQMITSDQLLLMDDVGKEHTTSTRFAEDEFDYLFRTRFNLSLPTILTTNVPVREWATNYSGSMESFVHEACIIVPVTGEDRRKRRG